jgi:hypothetical protein
MMYLTAIAILAFAFPDAMPDALPDASEPVQQAMGDWLPGNDGNQYLRDQWGGWWRYEQATGRIDSLGQERPVAMKRGESKPKPDTKAGHFETRRTCGPNGCAQTQVWVPDKPSAVPLPVPPPTEAKDDTQQPAAEFTPRRFFRRW